MPPVTRLPRLLWIASALSAAALAQDGLPPPPDAHTTLAGATLYLELVVNQQATGQVVPVLLRDGSFHVAAATLRAVHVRTPASAAAWVAVDRIAGVQVQYDAAAQRLLLMLPPAWLPAQTRGSGRAYGELTPSIGRGLLLNYDLYSHQPGRTGASTALWSEQRWFGPAGVLSHSGIARHSRTAQPQRQGYVRYDTSWRYADSAAVRTLTVGDLITATLPWGSAVRLGGVQLARNFSIRPDLVPYPLPAFSGEAAVPSAVDLFINGQRALRDNVQAGPFTLNTMPFLTGAGEAAVVTTDALGRQVLTTVPFYVSSQLLRSGGTDYALAAGALRRRYGQDSWAYGRSVASASGRYGVNDRLTLEAHGAVARGLRLAGGGAVWTLRQLGVFNAALAHGGAGRQWSAGYQYTAPWFGLSLQHQRRSAGWRDLALLERGDAARASRHSTQATASVSLGGWGALAAGFVDAQAHDGQRARLAIASYTRPLGPQSFLTVHLNRAIGTPDFRAQLQWTLMLGGHGSVSALATRDRAGWGQQLQYHRAPDSDGGLGWNLAYANEAGADDYRQGSLTWRGDALQLQAGAYAQGARSASWAGASGALVAMDGGWFATRRVYDGFALVATGVPDVPVRFENQPIGITDAQGHLLVPGISAYYPARFDIDVLQLPEDMQAAQTDQRVVVASGSGAVVRFAIARVRAASVTLVDGQGQPLAVGATVQHLPSGRTATLGWDGQVYLEGLADDNLLQVLDGERRLCGARFTLAADARGIARIGPLTCLPSAGEHAAEQERP